MMINLYKSISLFRMDMFVMFKKRIWFVNIEPWRNMDFPKALNEFKMLRFSDVCFVEQHYKYSCLCSVSFLKLFYINMPIVIMAVGLITEYQFFPEVVDDDGLGAVYLVCQQLLRQVVEHELLDGALYRTGTEVWVVALVCEVADGLWRAF